MSEFNRLGKIMTKARGEMNKHLMSLVVPYLRKAGFRGSLPHFRRLSECGTELLTIQFSMSSNRFVVEVAFREPYVVSAIWGDHIPPEKLTAHHVNERERIGKAVLGKDDPWFDFDRMKYSEVCSQVVASLSEAEVYWTTMKRPNQPVQPNTGNRPSPGDLPASATPSEPAPRG